MSTLKVPFLLIASLTFLVTLEAARIYSTPKIGTTGLISIGIVAAWRYFWLLLNIVRSAWYQIRIFPRIRRDANQLHRSEWQPEILHIILPTYMERPEVTRQVFQHICREISSLQCRTYLYVASGGEEENEVILGFFEGHPLPVPVV